MPAAEGVPGAVGGRIDEASGPAPRHVRAVARGVDPGGGRAGGGHDHGHPGDRGDADVLRHRGPDVSLGRGRCGGTGQRAQWWPPSTPDLLWNLQSESSARLWRPSARMASAASGPASRFVALHDRADARASGDAAVGGASPLESPRAGAVRGAHVPSPVAARIRGTPARPRAARHCTSPCRGRPSTGRGGSRRGRNRQDMARAPCPGGSELPDRAGAHPLGPLQRRGRYARLLAGADRRWKPRIRVEVR